MKKYKLINKTTGEEYMCNKVAIDWFDYYVSDEKATEGFYGYINFQGGDIKKVGKYFADDWKKVIATNNPNIDIPKVVDEVEELAWGVVINNSSLVEPKEQIIGVTAFYEGYKKSQETHSNSDEDMIDFYRWLNRNGWQDYNDIKEELFVNSYGVQKQDKELLQLWKEQQPKTIYYE